MEDIRGVTINSVLLAVGKTGVGLRSSAIARLRDGRHCMPPPASSSMIWVCSRLISFRLADPMGAMEAASALTDTASPCWPNWKTLSRLTRPRSHRPRHRRARFRLAIHRKRTMNDTPDTTEPVEPAAEPVAAPLVAPAPAVGEPVTRFRTWFLDSLTRMKSTPI